MAHTIIVGNNPQDISKIDNNLYWNVFLFGMKSRTIRA